MLKDLISLANALDAKGLYKEADKLDKMAMSLGRKKEWDFDFSEENRDKSIKSLVGTLIDQGRGLNLKEDLAELEGHSLRLLRELRGKEDKELDASPRPHVIQAKKRMLEWPNPVEYVNNMYGCHPGDDGNEYFEVVFGGLEYGENDNLAQETREERKG